MRETSVLVSVLLLLLLLVACTPKAAPAPQAAAVPAPAAAPQAPAVPAASVRPAWQEEWEKTLVAAKAENTLVLYTGISGERRRAIDRTFGGKYGLRIEALVGGGSALAPKVIAEQRAGIYAADVWLSGSTTHRLVKDAIERLDPALLLPELTEPELIKKTWHFGDVPWSNTAHTMLTGLMDLKDYYMTINTNLVKDAEIATYRDLLNPKWKGKISLNDPRVSGNGEGWFSASLETGDLDVNYIRELLTKQELFVTRDWRLQLEWLAHGKHAIAIAPNLAELTEFINMGLPIKAFSIGTPVVSGALSGTSMLNRGPHPNAAKLFVNWLFSQEGATLLSRAIGAQSQRLDGPTDHLRPGQVLKTGAKAFKSDDEDFVNKRATVYVPLAKEVFGP